MNQMEIFAASARELKARLDELGTFSERANIYESHLIESELSRRRGYCVQVRTYKEWLREIEE